MERGTIVLEALVQGYLQERYPQAAEALSKEIDSRGAEQQAAVAPKDRQALLTLLAEVNGDGEPMWATSYAETRDWVDGALDSYKLELQRLLYPLFAYTYLELLQACERGHAGIFFERFHGDHALTHRQELNLLSQVNTPDQLRTHEYSRRLLRQRYEIQMSAFSRALLTGFVTERKLHLVLRLLNDRVRIKIPTLAPPDSAGAGEAAEEEAHGGALLWSQVDAAELGRFNSTEVEWGALPELKSKHRELLHQLRVRQGLAPDEPPKEPKKRGKKGGAAGASGGVAEADKGKDGTVEALCPRVPLPPLNPKVEKEIVRDAARCARLSRTELPCALAVTLTDANCGAALCSIAFSNDGASVACGHSDSVVRVLLLKNLGAQPAAKKRKQSGEGEAGPSSAENGASSSTEAEKACVLAEAEMASRIAEAEMRPIFCLLGHSGPVYGVGWSRDDKFLISASQDGSARLWSVLQRACIVKYNAHASACWGVSFSPLGAYFATAGADRSLRVWAVSQLTPLRVLLGHASDVTAVTFHPTAALLASGGDDAAVRIWDLAGAKCVRLLVAKGHAAAVRALAFSPEGAQLASGGDDRAVLLWDCGSGAVLHRFRLHTKAVWAVSFSAQGAQLASGGADCIVGVWDVAGLVDGAAGETPKPPAKGVDGGAEGEEEEEDPRLLHTIFTKFTPVVAARFTRTNLLYVGGAFTPPGGYEERVAKQKRGRAAAVVG